MTFFGPGGVLHLVVDETDEFATFKSRVGEGGGPLHVMMAMFIVKSCSLR